jgi:hypothetical protein
MTKLTAKMGLAMTPMRWYAVLVALFGALCVLYACLTYGVYDMLDGIFGRNPTSEFAAQVAALRVNLKTAVGLYVVNTFVAFGSAIGFYFGRRWAKRLWLSWCCILLALIS